MSTIDDYSTIHTMLHNNGTYPGDPPPFSILTYINNWGRQTYAITHSKRDEARYLDPASPFITDPILLWSRATGLTDLRSWPIALRQGFGASPSASPSPGDRT